MITTKPQDLISGFPSSHLGSGTFNHLSLVQTDAPPLHSHQRTGYGHVALLVAKAASVLAVAVGNVDVVELRPQHVVRGDDHILLGEHVWLDEPVLLHTLINLSTRSEEDLMCRLISSTHWWHMELGEMMRVAPVETGFMATRQ